MASWFVRSHPNRAEAPAIHLRSASVDLDGNIIAAGTMSYAADAGGLFPLAAHDQLRIDRTLGLKITPCRSDRDPQSGFLQSESSGSTLSLPHELVPIILRALRIAPRERQNLTLGHQTGLLSSAPNSGDKRVSQQLSDWRLTLEERNGDLHVELVAALRSTVPLIPGKPLEDHWSADSTPPPRIVVAFRVDAATRVACFGAYTPLIGEPTAEDRARGTPVPVPTSLGALKLEEAPVGTFSQFATSGGSWVSIYESTFGPPPCLTISPSSPDLRLRSGFVGMGNHRWPRIEFRGIDLTVLADAMGLSPSIDVTLSSPKGGLVILSMGSDGMDAERIVETHLRVEVTPQGLALSYRCQSLDRAEQAKWREGTFVLSWELLILRYPRFLRYRDKIARPDG